MGLVAAVLDSAAYESALRKQGFAAWISSLI